VLLTGFGSGFLSLGSDLESDSGKLESESEHLSTGHCPTSFRLRPVLPFCCEEKKTDFTLKWKKNRKK